MDILGFRAPSLAATHVVGLGALEKNAAAAVPANGRLQIGIVRALDKAARVEQWQPVAGGYVARLHVSAQGAEGLRVKLALATVPGAIDVRVKGNEDRVEGMTLDPTEAGSGWTPWTNGPEQVIELFSSVQPSADAVRIDSILHFTDSPFSKAAAVCALSTMCTTGDAAIDTAMAEQKKSVVKLQFVDNGGAFLCTGTLINTQKFPAGYLLTANHCISTDATAGTLTTFWFYEDLACAGGGVNPSYQQVSGGAGLVFTNYNADSTLLLLNRAPASGAVYSAWNSASVPGGTPIVSISHPQGDTSRFAIGNVLPTDYLLRIDGRSQDEYGIHFTQGIIQGGSSGSGLFTMNGLSLELRGVLTGETIDHGGFSCTNTTETALYGRYDIFGPEIDQYIRTAPPQAADDAPNRAQDLFNAPVTDPTGVDMPLNQRTTPLVLDKRIDYLGDVDVFRFTIGTGTTVSLFTTGNMDTVGTILDSEGKEVETNDDGFDNTHGNYNFAITKQLNQGTYYLMVAPWDPAVTGPYTLHMTTASTTPPVDNNNYTDIWWNASESGWGINLNHQGTIIFGTLFTYDTDGPMWVVATMTKQSDGSFSGDLYRTTGSPYNAPYAANVATYVGTMRLAFTSASNGTLTYVVNGSSVTKSITRQPLSTTPPTCTFTTSDRSVASNYQDLWWNPNESGWGVNVNQQGTVVFATFFTYALNGKGMWYVLNGNRVAGTTNQFTGTLYRTTGAPFNAAWFAGNAVAVGTMTLNFSSGNAGTMTFTVDGSTVVKSIQRQVFGSPTTICQ